MTAPSDINSPDLTTSGITNIDTMKPANGFLGAAEARIMDFAEDAKFGLVKSMDSLVLAAHRFAAEIDTMAGREAGDFARSAADVVANLQRGLADKPVSELLEDGQDMIRRQPALAIGLAVAGGFLIARLARGSGSTSGTDEA